jgi:hypothetical protein
MWSALLCRDNPKLGDAAVVVPSQIVDLEVLAP